MKSEVGSSTEQPVFYEAAYLANHPEAKALIEAGAYESAKDHWKDKGKGFEPFWVIPQELDAAAYLLHYPVVRKMINAGDVASAAEHFVRFGNPQGFTFFQRTVVVEGDAPKMFPPYIGKRKQQPHAREQLIYSPIIPHRTPKNRERVRCDVVIPYDARNLKWLPQSVDSMLNQNFATCIVHLVNDGFNPELDEDIRVKYGQLPNVRMYRNDKSVGPYVTVNRLFDHLETDHFAIQDSDDISTPNRIWRSMMLAEKTKAAVIGGAMEQFVDFGSKPNEELDKAVARTPYHLSGMLWSRAPQGCVVNGTMLVRKDVFGQLNGFVNFFCGADTEFSTRCRAAGVKIHITDQIMGLRRLHNVSLSNHPNTNSSSEARRWAYAELTKRYRSHYFEPGFQPEMWGGLDKVRSGENGLSVISTNVEGNGRFSSDEIQRSNHPSGAEAGHSD